MAMSALCVATRSRAPRFGCTAISQASFFAQALHEVFINRLLLGGEVHEISCGQRKSPRAIAAGLNKEPVPFRGVPGEVIEREGGGFPDPAEKGDDAAFFCPMRVKQKKCALRLIKGAAPSGVTTFANDAEAAPKSMNRRLLWLIPEIKRPR